MARPKKETTEIVAAIPDESIKFELNAQIIAGSLTSNAKELKQNVEQELKNYTVDKYIGNPDAAKTDKATLNKVKDAVATKRKEITKQWNAPLDEFLNEMKSLEKTIDEASNALNKIVLVADQEEKDQKKKQIEAFYSTLDFKLVTLDRIFDPKWLNKTVKLDKVYSDISDITQKITTELSTLKSMQTDDAEILQAFYLETLDLNATIAKGNELKKNRETLKKQVEILEAKPQVKIEIPQQKTTNTAPVSNNTKMSFTLRLYGTVDQLMALRKYIDANKITYEKL